MKRLALWILGIGAGVLLHLAIAFAYWAELDGESRYDLGGAFMGNMLVSILPDMGQGIAGGAREAIQNGDDVSEDADPSQPAREEVAPVSEQADAESEPEQMMETSEEVAMTLPTEDPSPNPFLPKADTETETETETDTALKVSEPETDVAVQAVPLRESEPSQEVQEPEEQTASDEVQVVELGSETQSEPALVDVPTPQAKTQLKPDPVSQPESEPAQSVKPDFEPALELEAAVEEKADHVEPPEKPEPSIVTEPEEPVKQVSLQDGGALTSLPISAPRPKIKPEVKPQRTVVAQNRSASGQILRKASASAKTSQKAKVVGKPGSKGSVRGDGGKSDKAGGAGSRGVKASYATQLRRWIERHKRYPRSAKMRGVQGSGVVRIVIDRSGRVLSAKLVKSAGDRTLDDEIRALPMRASPAPKPPAEFSGSRHTLTLPVRFSS